MAAVDARWDRRIQGLRMVRRLLKRVQAHLERIREAP
jgi:hypothetical protein